MIRIDKIIHIDIITNLYSNLFDNFTNCYIVFEYLEFYC